MNKHRDIESTSELLGSRVRFSKVPKTFPARKAIHDQTPTSPF